MAMTNKKVMEEDSAHEGSHLIAMVFACIIPLLLILLLPLFGFSAKWSSILAITLMVVLHLLMMRNNTKPGRNITKHIHKNI